MTQLTQLWNQHGDAVIGLLASGFVANTISSIIVGSVKKTGKVWRVLRIAHGILNKVDPEGNQQ